MRLEVWLFRRVFVSSLSILYLRCRVYIDFVFGPLPRNTFNSLFEMHQGVSHDVRFVVVATFQFSI